MTDLVPTRYGPMERQMWDMLEDVRKQALAAIDMTDVCESCRAVADGWFRNLPRTGRHWPGGSQGVTYSTAYTVPQHLIEWDTKNAEQVAHIADTCRNAGHAEDTEERAA